jgi:ribonuclease G
MSKELVVSSTRHETRVALLEDDQVVEIYYQREKEYSLAGSIHKGRVTRVLPGMQSAFVDIGLDRDAFLYVSDFFEDNDEYDKVVTDAEEKVLRLEKGAGPAVMAPVVLATASPVAPPVLEEPPRVSAPQPPGNGQPAAPGGEPRTDDRDSRNNREGRGRSRRRRPRGGRGGIPESKYFSPSPRPRPDNAPPAEAAAATSQSDEDFAVLPGESLAKYGAADHPADLAAGQTDDARESGGPLSEEEIPEETAEAETMETLGAGTRSGLTVVWTNDPPETVTAAEEEPVLNTRWPEAAEPVNILDEPPVREPAIAMLQDDRMASDAPSSADLIADEPATITGASDNTAAADTPGSMITEVVTQEEGAEPARIPTSLTAALREQGPRYLQHRMSRRMRRKMRSGGPAPAEGQRPAEAVREVQAPPVRSESRPEPSRAPARAEKSGPPSISDLLREGQEIIVQIAKEPLGQKGARITSHIALPGRFLVYMPTVDHIGVSRKIPSDEERLRLKRILQANRTGIPGGYIVRTAGDGHTEEELRADMMFLYNMWLDIRQKAEKRSAPLLIHHDLDVVQRILRDQLTSAFKTIWVDNEEVYENVLGFVQRFQPALVNRVKLYTRSAPIFDQFNITSELEKALRPKVWLKSGGYIVINQTEALVAIDINTGKYVGKSNRLEDTIVKTNTDAVKEIVRQIRLRDLGGIIVVDFIDMDERKNRQKVMQALEDAMRADRAPNKILQFNDFGLVAITRKRVKQSLERTLCSPCPYCEGAGYVKSVQTVVGEILQEAQKIAGTLETGEVTLRVHPEVAKLFKSNKNDTLQEIEQVLGRTVLVKSDPLMHQEKFDLA